MELLDMRRPVDLVATPLWRTGGLHAGSQLLCSIEWPASALE